MSADSASVLVWHEELGALEARLGELFVRAEPSRDGRPACTWKAC
jgi:hypothetical protein